MSDDTGGSGAAGERAARSTRRASEKRGGRELDAATTDAIDLALALAARIAGEGGSPRGGEVIDVEVANVAEARFVLKRVNAALQTGEWLDEVRVWLWEAAAHRGEPRSERGARTGFELRIEAAPR